MLVLGRKSGESIVVPGYDIVITILHANGNHVRVGIEAPNEVAVHREEVWRKIIQHALPPSGISPSTNRHHRLPR